MEKIETAKGEEYQSPSTGKVAPACVTGVPCGCKKKCFAKITAVDSKTNVKCLFCGYGLSGYLETAISACGLCLIVCLHS